MTHAAAADNGHSWNLSSRQKLEIYGAILLVLFLFALDQTVVGTALPVIITELGGNDLYVWAVTVYLLTARSPGRSGASCLTSLADVRSLLGASPCSSAPRSARVSARRCGSSCSSGASRALAAARSSRWPSLSSPTSSRPSNAASGGLFGAVFGFSSVLGPWIGGLLTDFGWNWIFFVNVPVGLISFIVLWRLLPAIKRPEGARNIDYIGAAVFAAAIAPFLIGLTNKSGRARLDRPVVGGLMLLGLAPRRLHLDRVARAEPIVPLGLFRIRDVLDLGARDVPRWLRFLRRDHLPAALAPDVVGRARPSPASTCCRSSAR